jgi:hypothetical protein
MLSCEAKLANAFVLSRRMMIFTFAAILTWMKEALVLVNAFPAGYLEARWTSTRLHQVIVQLQIIITIT